MFSSLSPGDDMGLMTGNEAGDHGKKCFCAALLKRRGGGGVKGREPCSESVKRSNVMKGTVDIVWQ